MEIFIFLRLLNHTDPAIGRGVYQAVVYRWHYAYRISEKLKDDEKKND